MLGYSVGFMLTFIAERLSAKVESLPSNDQKYIAFPDL